MNEERWGEEWQVGDRIRYPHPDPKRPEIVEGTIRDKRWGRDKGQEIYNFTVVADSEETEWVVHPKNIQAAKGGLPTKVMGEHDDTNPETQLPNVFETETIVDKSPESLTFPVPFPERSGFGSESADDAKEWRRAKARWEKERGL